MNIMTAYDNPEEHSGPTMRGMPAYWGGSKTANFPVGTVAIDRDGDAWSRREDGWWWAGDRINPFPREDLPLLNGPFVVVYVPKGGVMTDPIQQRPADADVIAARLKEYLETDYFAGAIKDIYTLINHAAFLEKKVADLKAAIARMQEENANE